MGRLTGADVGDIEATPSPARINIESEEAAPADEVVADPAPDAPEPKTTKTK
jgi:hypothetical protein